VVVDHTATVNDEHAIEFIVDAAGFSDVKALDIDYITGNVGTGENEEAILVNVDETASTGGRFVGLEVLATGEGSVEVDGMEVGAGVHPIKQISGVFDDLDTILVIAVDQTTPLSSGGAGNISVFVNDNESITLGKTVTFEELEFIIDTPASGAGVAATFEYSTAGDTWTAFGPTDGTNGFKNTGVIAWLTTDIPSWATHTGGEFRIRITRTRNTLTTTPILDLMALTTRGTRTAT
jgi:hypothetical protein